MDISIKEYLSNIPLFSRIDHDRLLPFLADCDLKTFQPGQYIYKFGDYGEDCGIVLSGVISVELQQRTASGRSDRKIFLKEGDIFGEIAALSGYVRIADVAAVETTKVLIISKDTLLKLFDNFKAVKVEIDNLYRKRVLISQLYTTPLFMKLPESLIEKLIEKATLHTYRQGEVVFYQNDEADAFYLVRYGSVKITESGNDGREKVLAYLKGGHYFGEIALMKEDSRRIATVTAIDRTELIRISRDNFQHIIESYPGVKSSLEKSIEKIEDKNINIRNDSHIERTLSSFIDSGFIHSKEILIIDFTKCILCDSCVRACSALHDNKTRLIRRGVRLSNILLATSCRHCYDPTCMMKCPTGAIYRGLGGEIDYRDFCIGCGRCARNCPYGNIFIVEAADDSKSEVGKGFFPRYFKKDKNTHGETENREDVKKRSRRKKAVKCDMCSEYPFMACVYNCPTGAARRVDTTVFFADVISID
jgi:CRP-like cAMP-binding protein/Fe-S-cluster-containing hydrogenase component 2